MNTPWLRTVKAAMDDAFGPINRDRADPTLLFQQTTLTILPTALLLLISPLYVIYYNKSPVVSTESVLLWVKLAVAALVFVLHIVVAILDTSSNDAAHTAAAVFSCLAAGAVICLLYFEHRRALKSSALLSIYLATTVLFDIAKTRSCFLREGARLTGGLSVTITVAQFGLLVLEEVPKRYQSPASTLGEELRRGFWARTFFVWINSLLRLGFQRTLLADQLPTLGPEFASRTMAHMFEKKWVKSEISSLRLIKTCFWTVPGSFSSVVPARLLFIAFSYTHPFLIRRILQCIDDEEEDEDILNGLIGATALTYLGIALSRVWYTHMNNRFVTKIRGILISQMLRKNLLLRRDEAVKAAAVTLMSTDIDVIARTLPKIHEVWASIVELAVGIYLLSTIVREASFLVMIPALLSAVLSFELGRRSRPAMHSWNNKTEERVAKTSNILSQLKGIKMIACESVVAEYVQNLRQTEVQISKEARMLTVWTYVAAQFGSTFTPVIVIAGGLFWTGFDDFDANVAFTSLAFISLASDPIGMILTAWSRLGALVASFERIQNYLQLEERADDRGELHQLPVTCDEKQPLYNLADFPVQLHEACICPIGDKPPLLRANISLARSSVNMIIGPTACGKSTLLKGLLGEASIIQGSVHIQPGCVAYCSQETWLRNVSIRDNIIGEFLYDEVWYNTVTTMCLLRDLEEFPEGHGSLAGSRGSNLSGGQRQRIALARAIYSHAPILLLDDVFSAVDRATASTILGSLLGAEGLLRQHQVTVVMTTHTLEDLNYADLVLAIDHNSQLTVERAKEAIEKYGVANFLDADSDEGGSDSGGQDDPVVRQYSPPQLQQDDDIAHLRQRGDISLYRYYLGSVTAWVLIIWLILTILVAVTERFPDVFVRIWTEKDPDNKLYFVCYGLLAAVYLAFLAIWTWTYLLRLVPESSDNLHQSLLNSVTRATLSFLTCTDSGAILNKFSQDMSLISQDLPTAFMFFLYTLFGVIADLIITLSASPYAAILFPFILALLYGLQLFYLRTSRQARLLDLEAKTPLYTHFTETSDGLQHIRAFGWEDQVLTKGEELLDHSQKPFYFMYCIQRWLSLVLDLTVAGIAIVLVAVALNVRSTKQPALGLALLYAMKLGPQFTYLMDEWVDLETSLGALFRLRAFGEDTPVEETLGTSHGQGPRRQMVQVPETWPEYGDIDLNGVSSYYSTASGRNRQALRDVSVAIHAGTKNAIVGRTGSGKSSLFLTLLNFLEYTGSIIIDGIEVSTVPRSVLRSRIISISQDLIHLPSSVRDNLTPHDMNKSAEERLPEASIFDALAKVGLDDYIRTCGGLDVPLDEVNLSQGQRQLLALARALIQMGRTRSTVILVDEATSSVDIECEKKMQDVMDGAFEGCTVLTIAHRMHTMNAAHCMLEMSHGRLVGEGS